MARERMVTRTVEVNIITVMTVNTKTKEVANSAVTISGTLKDEKETLKKVKAEIENEAVKVVTIVSTEKKEVLFGMSEQEFITLAKVLPPRTTASANED